MDTGKLRCWEVEVAAEVTPAEAIAKTKRLRWVLRQEMGTPEEDTWMGRFGQRSLLEFGLRRQKEKTVVRIWFATGNRQLVYEVGAATKWVEWMTGQLKEKGWAALER